ncbi:MAG: hypothetical protein RJA76_2214 [Bacteroidota bacterium]
MKENNSKYILARLLVRSYRFIKHVNSEFLKSRGYEHVKIGHVMVMMNIQDGAMSVSELVKNLEMSKQAVSVLIKELVHKNFVNTCKHPEDSRAILVSQTEEGSLFMDALHASRQNLDLEVSKILGDDRLEDLKHLLVDLVDGLEQKWGRLNDSIGNTKL